MKATMTVKEMATELNISLPKAYELVNTKSIPSIKIGSKIAISTAEFTKWLSDNSKSHTKFTG